MYQLILIGKCHKKYPFYMSQVIYNMLSLSSVCKIPTHRQSNLYITHFSQIKTTRIMGNAWQRVEDNSFVIWYPREQYKTIRAIYNFKTLNNLSWLLSKRYQSIDFLLINALFENEIRYLRTWLNTCIRHLVRFLGELSLYSFKTRHN